MKYVLMYLVFAFVPNALSKVKVIHFQCSAYQERKSIIPRCHLEQQITRLGDRCPRGYEIKSIVPEIAALKLSETGYRAAGASLTSGYNVFIECE